MHTIITIVKADYCLMSWLLLNILSNVTLPPYHSFFVHFKHILSPTLPKFPFFHNCHATPKGHSLPVPQNSERAQGRRLVEYNHHKKEELKCLNEQITEQDHIDHKPRSDTNTYVYVSTLSVFGLAIGGYFLYSKFKKPEQTLTDVPTPPVLKSSTEPKRNALSFKCSKNFYHIIHKWLKTI